MTNLSESVLLGCQTPTLRLVPDSVANSVDEVVELCRICGLVLDEWQVECLRAGLGEAQDGRWSAFEVGVEVSRQNGKGEVLFARELAGIFLFGEKLILHSAHEFRTARDAFRKFQGWLLGTEFESRIKRVVTGAGNESIEFTNGSTIRFVSRSRGLGRGFSADLVVLDEAMILSDQSMAAVLPTLAARPNPQVWYAASAAFADSTVWHGVRDRALAGIKSGEPGRLAYCGWEASEDSDPADRAVWALTNPALGSRLSIDGIEGEFAAMTTELFRRERLGIPDRPLTALLQIVDPEHWGERERGASKIEGRLVLGVDVQPGSRKSAIGAAGLNADGDRHIEFVDSEHVSDRAGTKWVVPELVRLARAHLPAGVAVDPGTDAGALIPDMVEAFRAAELDVPVILMKPRDHAQAVSAFLQGVAEGGLVHVGQPALARAVSGAQLRPLADASAFKRRDSSVDITPLVAATLALGAFISLEPEVPVVDYSAMFQII